MNKKEIREIRKRVRPDYTNIEHVYGCYVNGEGEIISRIDESLGLLTLEEKEKYINLLRKSLSGTPGRNLIDIEFSTKQVQSSDEHRLLSELRRTALKDQNILEAFYKCVVDNVDMGDDNYIILIAFDSYDVPKKDKNDEDAESDEVFRYIICSVSPVKTGKPVLSYSNEESRFRNLSLSQVIGQPEMGFMFPAFDNRSSNIYNALFYSRDGKGTHDDFIDAVFKTEVPMSALSQKDAFTQTLSETLKKECTFDVIQSVHDEIRQRIENCTEEDEEDGPLMLSYEETEEILEKSGMTEDKKDEFISACKEQFGENKTINPRNIINAKRFEIETEQAKIKIDPAFSSLVKTKVIDGHKYILIPADSGAEVNGVSIEI